MFGLFSSTRTSRWDYVCMVQGPVDVPSLESGQWAYSVSWEKANSGTGSAGDVGNLAQMAGWPLLDFSGVCVVCLFFLVIMRLHILT